MSWMEETRWAKKQHLCDGCGRAIDEEDYRRLIVPDGTEHRRSFTVFKWCRDCRRV